MSDVVFQLQKIRFPFEGNKWVISRDGDSPFGMYDTKKEALKDAREFGLKLEQV